jgi:hypothetical protein
MQRTDSTMGGPETECIQRSATSGKLTGQHKQLLATPPLPILATHLNILRDSNFFTIIVQFTIYLFMVEFIQIYEYCFRNTVIGFVILL